MQRRDHMGGRGEAPLPGFHHVDVLVVQVHRQRVRVASRGGQRFLAGEDKTHPRYTFQAFAGGGDQRVERYFLRIHGQCAEGAHGVDDQAFAVLRDDLGDFGQRIENAGAGFAVDQRHVRNVSVGAQQAVDVGGGGRFVFGGFEGAERAAEHFADFRQALAVRAIDQHEDFAVARHQRADRRFDGKSAAAL